MLLDAAEFFFEFAEVHFDEGGPAMRTGVGHGAMAQVFDQVLQFGPGQRIVGLDGMAADGLGDGLLAQAQGVDALRRRP